MEETISFEPDEEAIGGIEALIARGYICQCLVCDAYFVEIPYGFDRDAGADASYCPVCGEDLFIRLEERLARGIRKIEVGPVVMDGMPTLIFKDYNFRHCRCRDDAGGEHRVHTGDADSECGRKWNLPEIEDMRTDDARVFVCACKRTGGWIREPYRIVILKPAPEEAEKHKGEYMGSWFFKE